MTRIIHRADTRGRAEHGWLHSHHSFSFARYYDPERMGFGTLRVLNDDVVEAGAGFGTHPHEDMEIISIPLSGALRHRDSMSNTHVIRAGEVQIMSAGTGITHSEYNDSGQAPVNFLQIWLIPKQLSIAPRYDQRRLDPDMFHNKLHCIVAPVDDLVTGNGAVGINQDAWFFRARLEKGQRVSYALQGADGGVYLFVIEGTVKIDGETLNRRDGIGLQDAARIEMDAAQNSDILLMEVPMH